MKAFIAQMDHLTTEAYVFNNNVAQGLKVAEALTVTFDRETRFFNQVFSSFINRFIVTTQVAIGIFTFLTTIAVINWVDFIYHLTVTETVVTIIKFHFKLMAVLLITSGVVHKLNFANWFYYLPDLNLPSFSALLLVTGSVIVAIIYDTISEMETRAHMSRSVVMYTQLVWLTSSAAISLIS